MGSVIAGILPLALAIVASAAAIIALIVLLMGGRGTVVGGAFCAGWFLGVMAVMALAITFGLAAPADSPRWELWTRLVIGALLLALAMRKILVIRRAASRERRPPRWMSGLAGMGAGRALLLGALLAGVNPKNLLLALAAASAVVASTLPEAQMWGAAAIFAVIASGGVLVPFSIYLVMGARAKVPLASVRTWMEGNTDGITLTILLIFGAKLVADGIAGLT